MSAGYAERDLPAQPLPPDVRHNIFLIVKEALTNILKHAGATEVQLQIKFAAANSGNHHRATMAKDLMPAPP